MKKLTSNKSGKEIYGQKWQITETSSDSKSDEDLHSAPAESGGTAQISGMEAAKQESRTILDSILNERREGSRMDEQSMYRAALDGDWIAAEVLLGRDPTLASKPITEKGDLALHLACTMKHIEFVEKLVQRISPKDLELVDGRGYTACCYAATSGVVEIARVMIDKSPDLISACYRWKVMPLHKAALRGNKEMVSYLLKIAKIGDLNAEEWFDLLLVTIRRHMFDVAMEIVEVNGSLATMANDQGETALHLLARQAVNDIRSLWRSLLPDPVYLQVKEPTSFNRLAMVLWALMQQLEHDSLLQLLKQHHILHDAAKAGHGKLVTMIIRTYPQLMWETDGNQHTLFHVAIRYRQHDVIRHIPQAGALIDSIAESQDEEGNNILHLAAKLVPLDRVKAPQSTILLKHELALFKYMEARVPPSCLETRNNEGLTPRDLFSKEHKSLFEYSRMWMKNTADSFMLIATIFLTVVFGVAFAVPGGYNNETGEPVLMKELKYQMFLIFEVIAVLGSVISIMMFRSVLASTFAEDNFWFKLPLQLSLGFFALSMSLTNAVSAFLVSISLRNPYGNGYSKTGSAIMCLATPYWIYTGFSSIFKHHIPLYTKV